MENNEFVNYGLWNDGCTSRGACSLSPTVAALQELLLYIIKQNAYYILKLDSLNLNNENLIKSVIIAFSSLVFVDELSDKHLYSIVLQMYYAFINAKKTYIEVCEARNIDYELIDFETSFNEKTSFSSAISEGEKILVHNYKSQQYSIRNHFQILFFVLKSICLTVCKLYDLNIIVSDCYAEILKGIYIINSESVDKDELLSAITLIAQKDNELNLRISAELRSNFGELTQTSVSHSTKSGKAILVSGNNFFDLLNILELTKNIDIDVYTHSKLLIAHSFEKFRKYTHLIGHYGNTTQDCIIDYGTFPGAIILTNNSQNNTEFLYKGKIFSNGYNVPQGVIKIENNDYTPLIDAALSAKGFSKGKIKPDTIVGFDENEITAKLKGVIEKFITGDIKHIYIIIGNSYTELQKAYFDRFFEKINIDEFVLSFSYGKQANNVMLIDLGDYYPLILEFIAKTFSNVIKNKNLTFILNNCSVGMVSAAIHLHSVGAQNTFVSHCSPRQINPAVFDTFVHMYNISCTSIPDKDIEIMRK